MSKRLSGLNPLAYMGVEPLSPPAMHQNGRAPTNTDSQGYNLGDFWIVIPPGYDGPEQLFVLISLNMGQATWAQLYPGSASSTEYQADTGTATPALGILKVVGDGMTVNTSASGNTITISSDSDVADEYVTDSGTATPSSNTLRIVGGTNINTAGASNTVTINLDDNVTLAGNLDVEGNTILEGTLQVLPLSTGVVQSNGSGDISSSKGNNGQLLIGSTAGAPAWANLTSLGGTITITNNANAINLESEGGGGGGGTNCAFFLYQSANVNIPNSGAPFFQGLGASEALTKKFDVGNNVTTGDGAGTAAIFTAPIDGKYYLGMGIKSNYQPTVSSSENPEIQIVTPSGTYQFCQDNANGPFANAFTTNAFSVCADLSSGDEVTFEVQIPTLNPNGIRLVGSAAPFVTYINGFLVGAGAGATIVSRFTSSGTWTKNTNTQYIEVYVVCAGGGGASGSTGASGVGSFGGGGAGSWGTMYMYGPAFMFGASQTITIAAGGTGGTGVSTPNTTGNPGGNGGASSFGIFTTAAGENPPGLGNGGGLGGQIYTPGYYGDIGMSQGLYIANNVLTPVASAGNSFGTGGNNNNSFQGIRGLNRAINSFQPGTSDRSVSVGSYFASGTGGGGAGSSSDDAVHSGGNGGSVTSVGGLTVLVAGGAGGEEGVTLDGGNGADGLQVVGVMNLGAGGGGGGNQVVGTRGGNGGDGGFPGGAGGGGGSATNGSTSGSGGDGAAGIVIIVEYT